MIAVDHALRHLFISRCRLLLCLLVFATTSAVIVAANEYDEYDETEKPPKAYKPKLWFLKETQISGVKLPLSPLSLFVMLLVAIHVTLNWGTYAYCEASHILIKVHSPEAKQALKELLKEIGGDYDKFAEMAKKHSDCPSGRQGGDLGRFYRGDMAKNFDRACFDPRVPTGKAVGPVETTFGWHIIFIRKRSI